MPLQYPLTFFQRSPPECKQDYPYDNKNTCTIQIELDRQNEGGNAKHDGNAEIYPLFAFPFEPGFVPKQKENAICKRCSNKYNHAYSPYLINCKFRALTAYSENACLTCLVYVPPIGRLSPVLRITFCFSNLAT